MRRNQLVTAVAGVLALAGGVALAMAVQAQEQAPQPGSAVFGPPGLDGLAVERHAGDMSWVRAGGFSIPDQSTTTTVATTAVEDAEVDHYPVSSLPPSLPVAIDIPAIAVHSSLQSLGLTEDGEIEVPQPGPRYNDAGWYRYSSTPGSVGMGSLGSAIIVGHIDSFEDGPSVFFRLGALQPGDEVMVTRSDGLVAVFRVDAVRVYPKDEFPITLVYGPTPHPTLRLITCGGVFDDSSGSYEDNIVVFATMIGAY